MQSPALSLSRSLSLSLSLRLGPSSRPEDFLGGQSAGEENQFVKGRKSERSLVPLLFFCFLSAAKPLSVIIHGRRRYYLAGAGNMSALHTTIALAQLLRRRQEPQQRLNATAVPRMAGRLITVCGQSGGWRKVEVELPQRAFTRHTQLPGPPAPPPAGCTHNLPAGRLTAVAAGKSRLGSPAVQGGSAVICK